MAIITQIVSTNEKGDDFPVVMVTNMGISFQPLHDGVGLSWHISDNMGENSVAFLVILIVTPFPILVHAATPTHLPVYDGNDLRCYVPWVSIVQHRVGCPYWPRPVRLTPQELTKLLQDIWKYTYMYVVHTTIMESGWSKYWQGLMAVTIFITY